MPTPAIAKAAEEIVPPAILPPAGSEWRLKIGDGVLGEIVFVADPQGGHIEFQGKVWRPEK